jgi:hypothetical protein
LKRFTVKKGQFIEEKAVKGAQNLLVAWDSFIDDKVNNSRVLLESFEKRTDIQDAVHAEQRRIQSMPRHLAELIKSFSEQGIDKLVKTFNPLDVLLKNYYPNEDDHSNLMAALLDPSKKHGLGLSGIYVLLDIVAQRKRSVGEICAAIRNEIKTEGKVRVENRQRGKLSAIDIKLLGQNFFIGIENKRSFGHEHETPSGPQTKNEYTDSIDEKKQHNLLVFIHPKGIAPKSRYFVLIDKQDVTDWYQRIAKQAKDQKLGALLKFYADYYFRTI